MTEYERRFRDEVALAVLRELKTSFSRLPNTAELLAKDCYKIADAFIVERAESLARLEARDVHEVEP